MNPQPLDLKKFEAHLRANPPKTLKTLGLTPAQIAALIQEILAILAAFQGGNTPAPGPAPTP